MSSVHPQAQSQDADEEELDDPSSPEYIILIRDVVKYVQQERQPLLSAADDHDLERFEAFSGKLSRYLGLRIPELTGRDTEDAQKLLVCLTLIRKDLKWHPIRRMLKLGARLDLNRDKLASTMLELCKVGADGSRAFARDESQMSMDERLLCLTVEQFRTITGGKEPTKASLERNSPAEVQSVQATLSESLFPAAYLTDILVKGNCIQIQEHVVRLFRRLILVYYACVRPCAKGYVRHEGAAPQKIIDAIGNRFTSTPEALGVQSIDNHRSLVRAEELLFPNPNPAPPKRTGTNDNYLLIFDDILAFDKLPPGRRTATAVSIADAVATLSDAARHVLAGIILSRTVDLNVRDLTCVGLFDPVNDGARVITELCDAQVGEDGALCQNEYNEEFNVVLGRLTIKELIEIGKQHRIKAKKSKGGKQSLIDAFMAVRTQSILGSNQTYYEILMPKVLDKLDGSRNPRVSINPEFRESMEFSVKRYFQRQDMPPYNIAGKPFKTIRQRFSKSAD
ncbi:hypothetical protein C8R46DRAFT_1067356 [Mycena filopes]|nr:hypothetical protein C8R46DRAFT_1067356 [Mycena filopes]